MFYSLEAEGLFSLNQNDNFLLFKHYVFMLTLFNEKW